MNILELLKTYGIDEKDWEDIKSLKPYFSEEFRRKLGQKTKEFVLKELPVSKKMLEDLNLIEVFDPTIENFFNILFQSEKLNKYVNSMATMHAKFEIPPEDFVQTFLAFFQYVLDNADIPPEKIPAFRKFTLVIVSVLTFIIVYHWLAERRERELDPITKLSSKKLLMSNLSELIKSSKTIALLDIDEFKEVNLYYGYNAGNSVLRFIASTLRMEFECSFITRLQSDDFIILSKLHKEEVFKKLKKLKQEFRKNPVTFPTNFGIEKFKLNFYASVLDTALLPNKNINFGILIWILGSALEKARGNSSLGIKVIEKADIEKALDKRSKAFHVINALNKNFIKAAFQDVVDAKTGKVVFKEALARIVTNNSVMSAGSFIDAISGSNIERDLDRAVVKRVLEVLKRGKVKSKVSVNLSAEFIKLYSGWFLKLIKSYGIEPSQVIVELTERSDLLESEETIENLQCLKKEGIGIYIDDFGVKYANYNLLRELPVEGIKIDGSIVKNLRKNTLDQAFVSCVLQIAKMKGLKIVAEYVETEETKRKLEQLAEKYGIDSLYIQGYLFSRPEIIS